MQAGTAIGQVSCAVAPTTLKTLEAKHYSRTFLLQFQNIPPNPTLSEELESVVLAPPPLSPYSQRSRTLPSKSPSPVAAKQAWFRKPKPIKNVTLPAFIENPVVPDETNPAGVPRIPLGSKSLKQTKNGTPQSLGRPKPSPLHNKSNPTQEKENLENTTLIKRPIPDTPKTPKTPKTSQLKPMALMSKSTSKKPKSPKNQMMFAWTPKSDKSDRSPRSPISPEISRFGRAFDLETDDRRLEQRQKQIDYGYNTEGYKNYLLVVPKHRRRDGMPQTPEKRQKCSKRSWDGQIRKWRRQLHEWDNPAAAWELNPYSSDPDSISFRDYEMIVPDSQHVVRSLAF